MREDKVTVQKNDILCLHTGLGQLIRDANFCSPRRRCTCRGCRVAGDAGGNGVGNLRHSGAETGNIGSPA